jgi:hypothetical protein
MTLINDMASALFLQGFMIGELFGPIIGLKNKNYFYFYFNKLIISFYVLSFKMC